MNLLTVLLPTIGRDTLARAIDSVHAQTVPCELIVEHDAKRIGPGPMLHRMLPRVSTPWVSTFADDDVLEPTFAELLAEHADAADMVVFQMRYQHGAVLPMVTDPAELHWGGVGCSYAVRTDVARRLGGWVNDGGNPILPEDWLMISAVRDSGAVIRIVPQVAYLVCPVEEADE